MLCILPVIVVSSVGMENNVGDLLVISTAHNGTISDFFRVANPNPHPTLSRDQMDSTRLMQ